MFEPMSEENEDDSDTDQHSSDEDIATLDDTVHIHGESLAGRSIGDPGTWCKCGHCINDHMADSMCICCQEWTILEGRHHGNDQCISTHSDIDILCLNPVVLLSMWPFVMVFKGIRGPIPLSLNNR